MWNYFKKYIINNFPCLYGLHFIWIAIFINETQISMNLFIRLRMASNGNSLLSNEATIKTTISEAIDCLESHTDIHCSETPPPSKAARLSINDGEQIKLINNNLEDGEINNIELEYKNITATRNGWNRLYQV